MSWNEQRFVHMAVEFALTFSFALTLTFKFAHAHSGGVQIRTAAGWTPGKLQLRLAGSGALHSVFSCTTAVSITCAANLAPTTTTTQT
jgi:hypothetical protein